MSARFDTDTAVVPNGDGSYAARMDGGWWIQRGPNGGYVAAVLVQALTASVDDRDRPLRSLTVHYLAPAVEGPVEVEVSTDRNGRTIRFVSARMLQGERLIAIARAAYAVPNPAGPAFADATFPAYAPPSDDDGRSQPVGIVPMRDRYDYSHVLGAPWDGPSSQAETGGWIRLREPRPYDAALVVALTDAWYPAIFTRVQEPMGVPTIDLTVHIRSVDALRLMRPEDWMAVRFRTTVASEGFLEEDGELWTPDGTLVAHSRQLGLILAQ
ncbi:MAG: thioesterase family protein [Acidimicrobiia bacterium]|nr:thioesterase family protein [Acidimicrobiia bacterium]